jgi:hypothetical protein
MIFLPNRAIKNNMPVTPTSTPSTSLLAQLAAITGSEFDHERARIAVQNVAKADADPLGQLVSAAAEVYMHVSPVRVPLSEALWQAHHDTPVVVWNKNEARWVVITFAGWFSLRIPISQGLNLDGSYVRTVFGTQKVLEQNFMSKWQTLAAW